MALLVYNIQPASSTMINALHQHCSKRTPDGASNIDLSRSHLNRHLHGQEGGLNESLSAFYKAGVKRPTRQAEKPYLRLVVSASPAYFRPNDPSAAGTWETPNLERWLEATMQQLHNEHGTDLIWAELHLDEDTPHIHAVVAPTYLKKPRVPGKRRKGKETEEAFEARKAAARASKGIRTVGRASHPTLKLAGSFTKLRQRMASQVAHLGIEYGTELEADMPSGRQTREWIKEGALRAEEMARQNRAAEGQAIALVENAEKIASDSETKFERAYNALTKAIYEILSTEIINKIRLRFNELMNGEKELDEQQEQSLANESSVSNKP